MTRFRVVLEEVWPQLAARVDAESGVLAVKAREMAARCASGVRKRAIS
jgi:hypothetical protein